MRDRRAKKPPKPLDRWAVMRVQPWSAVLVGGVPLGPDESGSVGFIPVFASREDAIRFAGSDTDVLMAKVSPKETSHA